MGTCFGCCPIKIQQRKMPRRTMFIRSDGVGESFHGDREEFLELDERGGKNYKRPDSRNSVDTISGFIKPGFIRKKHFCWLGKDNLILTRTVDDQDGLRSPSDAMMPLLYSEYSLGDNSSLTGSQRWEQIGTASGSSVDLEWENEIGITDEHTWNLVTETTNTSWRSSPVSISNGLEWDGDYTSVEVSEMIQETQKLIDASMDQRTGDTQSEANNNR